MPVSQTEHIAGYRHLCAGYGRIDGPTSRLSRECSYRHELDVEKFLSGTRGRDFPLARLEMRLRCPRCGSRAVRVLFEPPSTATRIGAR